MPCLAASSISWKWRAILDLRSPDAEQYWAQQISRSVIEPYVIKRWDWEFRTWSSLQRWLTVQNREWQGHSKSHSVICLPPTSCRPNTIPNQVAWNPIMPLQNSPMMNDTDWAAIPCKTRGYALSNFSLYHFRTNQLSLPSPWSPSIEPSRRSQHIQCSTISIQCIYPIPCTLKLYGRGCRVEHVRQSFPIGQNEFSGWDLKWLLKVFYFLLTLQPKDTKAFRAFINLFSRPPQLFYGTIRGTILPTSTTTWFIWVLYLNTFLNSPHDHFVAMS